MVVPTNMYNVMPEEMDEATGRMIENSVIAGGAILFGIIGSLLASNPWWGFGGGVLSWLAIYVFWGYLLVKRQWFAVIERMGYFYQVAFTGPRVLCLPGVVDKVRAFNTLQYQKLPIYSKPGEEINFTDGTAPIEAAAYFCIGMPKPEEVDEDGAKKTLSYVEWRERVRQDVIRFAYAFTDPVGRMRDLLYDLIRPRLQKMSISQAQTEEESFVKNHENKDEAIKRDIRDAGMYLHPEDAFQLNDIKLSPELREMRAEAQRGEAIARKLINQGKGISAVILAVAQELKISRAKAAELVKYRWGLDTVESAKTNITFVGRGVPDILYSLGQNSGENQQKGKQGDSPAASGRMPKPKGRT